MLLGQADDLGSDTILSHSQLLLEASDLVWSDAIHSWSHLLKELLLLHRNDTLSSHKILIVANRWWCNTVTSVLIEVLEMLSKIRHVILLLLSGNQLLKIALLIWVVLLTRLIEDSNLRGVRLINNHDVAVAIANNLLLLLLLLLVLLLDQHGTHARNILDLLRHLLLFI